MRLRDVLLLMSQHKKINIVYWFVCDIWCMAVCEPGKVFRIGDVSVGMVLGLLA